MIRNKETFWLILILGCIVFLGEILSGSVLYNVAFEQQREQLRAVAKSQARLIEVVARFETSLSGKDSEDESSSVILSQIREAYKTFEGFGKTGDLIIGKLENDQIRLLSHVQHKNDTHLPGEVHLISQSNPFAIPIRQALLGTSGSIVGKDQRGELVLAAYEPIAVLNLALVAKINLSEIREPFIKVGIVSLLVALGLIFVGAFLFYGITNPVIRRLYDSENYNRTLFELSPIGLALCRMDGTLVDINQSFADIIGRSIEQTKSLSYWDITPKDYAEEEQRQLEDLEARGQYGPYEKEYLHKDGTRVPVSLLGQIVERDGEQFIWSSVENISQRKIVERQERETRQQLQLLLNSTSEAIYGIDVDGHCTFINSACLEMLGYDSDQELLGNNMHQLIHYSSSDGGEYSIEDCRICRAHQRGDHVHGDNESFWRKDGTPFPVEYSSNPVLSEENVVGSVITFNDITERKQAQAALQEAFTLNDNVINESPIGIAIYDASGQCITANASIAEIFNATRDQVLAQNYKNIDSWKKSGLLEIAEKSIHLQHKQHYEFDAVSSFGKPAFYDAILAPFKINDDQHLLLMLADVSERKATERALKDSEETFARAQAIAHIGSWNWDMGTNEIYWSDEIYRIFGLEPQQVSATYDAFLNYIHIDDRQSVIDAVNLSIVDPEVSYKIEHRIVKPDGEVRVVQEQGEVYRSKKGEAVRMIGTVHDITNDKKIEKELVRHRDHLEELVEERTNELHEAQDELLRSNRLATLGQLTATVSHELRNPLSAMRPSIYIMRKLLTDEDPRLTEALERIDRNTTRCDHIIDDLLDYTRITAVDFESILFDEWLKTVIDERIIPEGIAVEKEFTLDNLELAVDNNRLRRVVINVVDNACQAMQDEQQQVLDKEDLCLSVKTRVKNGRVEVVIGDTGVGMSKEILSKVFEPLFSTRGFGVGLGMPTVRQIMEQHNGGIEVESKEGKGTNVTLWLPQKVSEMTKQRGTK